MKYGHLYLFVGPGLAGTRMSPFWILLELRMMEVVVATEAINRHAKLLSNRHHNKLTPNFLQVRCPSWRPTNSVRALKGVAPKGIGIYYCVAIYTVSMKNVTP